MRSRTRRRSTSSRCSPGPRPPMPPPSRESPSSRWARRGSRYFSCASSTCSLPSRERARCAKMSRISWVRSITRSSRRSAMLRACAGERSWSKITRSASCWKARTTRSSRRPEPTTVRGSICGRTCTSTSAISTPAERASSRSSTTASSVSWRGRPARDRDQDRRDRRAPIARVRVVRASSSSSAPIQSSKSRSSSAGGRGGMRSTTVPSSAAGRRCATCASVGSAVDASEAERHHRVEAELGEVGQVVVGQRLVAEDGVDAAQAAQASLASAQASPLGHLDRGARCPPWRA